MIRRFEENEETRKIIARLAKEKTVTWKMWIQIYTEVTGLDDEQKMTVADGFRRAVEARRKGQERQPTAAQEQGKRVCFTGEEKGGARSARGARAIDGKKEGEHLKRVKKSGRSRRSKGLRKMTMNGFQSCPTLRQMAHTSRPFTQEMRFDG